MKYIVINWKANKTLKEAKEWVKNLKTVKIPKGFFIIIAPPFPFLVPLKELVKNLHQIKLAAQNISKFEKGEYTGEVTAENLSGIVEYSILGHSERRKIFNESYDSLIKKVKNAFRYNIKPIFCINEDDYRIPPKVNLVSYEPVEAIGTGNNEDVNKVLEFKHKTVRNRSVKFFYGGSVNENNINIYLTNNEIDGVLIGSASLNFSEFTKVLNKLSSKK